MTNNYLLKLTPYCNVDESIKQIMVNLIIETNHPRKDLFVEKILKNDYFDTYIFDGRELTKQDVINLQNKLIYNSGEEIGYIFYIIKNIDRCSSLILNSLLKTIEEAEDNIVGIFVCDEFENVLSTIVSRCTRFILMKDEKIKDKINEILSRSGLEYLTSKNIFANYEDLFSLDSNNELIKIKNIIESFNREDLKLVITNREIFNNLSYLAIKYVINILFFLSKDLLAKKNLASLLSSLNTVDLNKKGIYSLLIAYFFMKGI
ncbi:hypothetical protein [Ureaplasma canigenitalium]|uniref:hypothetical protein n=1 Tax=Ureaplasma canigenitalium TaxID=42092 RepID=UPI0004E23B20|nr:hypothetical protein [Ureaplasma canigenitalium]